VISTTEEHPFWVPDKGWVEAEDLAVGSWLQLSDGTVVDVDKIEKRDGEFEVYNFKVEDFHTYFVSELGLLVHNANYNDPPLNVTNKIPNDELLAKPKKRGLAPTGNDGFPVELHHTEQTQDGAIAEMSRTDHRLGDNYARNHENTGGDDSLIDRKQFDRQKRKYWANEYDNGRFEDNGRVAYGYLIKNSNIISDVWLYNHNLPSHEPEWKDPSKMPFENPRAFASILTESTVESKNDLSFHWEYDEKQQLVSVKIKIREETYGLLKPDSRVGWAKLALKDGPLAKNLVAYQVRNVLSRRINDLNGRAINKQESKHMVQMFDSLLPKWFMNLLVDFPLTGCYFELPEDIDRSEIGVDMQWMNPSQIISEATDAYPGKIALVLGYLPIGMCMVGTGDYYFIQFKAIDLPIVRIPHNAVKENHKLIEEKIELVCAKLVDFFETVEILD
jgi:Pretoxin HINT domain/A nuclease of the HNH/ENDO VII superfamily with conserved LHH